MEICNKCRNSSWETTAQVAACNCCEEGEYFDPLPVVECTFVQTHGSCCFPQCDSILKGKLEDCPEEARQRGEIRIGVKESQ